MRSSHLIHSIGMLACGALAASSANAATVLTGGDSTDGFVASGTAVVATNFGGSPVSGTIQGVTFPTNAGSVTLSANLGSFGSSTTAFASPTANDTKMQSVVGNFIYSNAANPALTLTVTGLAAGSYTADIFVGTDGSPRAETVSINDPTFTPLDTISVVNGVAEVSHVSFTATGTGTDKIVLTRLNDGAIISGLVISTAAPEPTSLALLGLGSMGLLVRRRRA